VIGFPAEPLWNELECLLAQVAEIGQVCLRFHPLAFGDLGEGFRHARIVAVYDHDIWAVAGREATQDGRRKDWAYPKLVAADDDAHVRELANYGCVITRPKRTIMPHGGTHIP
jgi:hypothetical protein